MPPLPSETSAAPPRRRWARIAFWLLVTLSVASLVLSPLGPLVERAREVGPWVGIGLIISEVLFAAGLAIMGWSVGISMGFNPLAWRGRLETVLAQLNRSPMFWAGLVLNTIGAVGTAAVLGAAVVAGLPLSAWGLLVLPVADLSLTLAVRTAVVGGVRRPQPGIETDTDLNTETGTDLGTVALTDTDTDAESAERRP